MFQVKCFTKFEEVKQEVTDLKNVLCRILQSSESKSETVHKYPTLPLRTLEELRNTEAIVSNNEEQYKALVILLNSAIA